MPRGNGVHKWYAPASDKQRGNMVHKIFAPEGGGMPHADGMHRPKGSPPPRPAIAHKRKSKPPSKALPKTPAIGKSGGSHAGQKLGKIV